MQKVFSKDVFLAKKIEEAIEEMIKNYQLDEHDGKTLEELKKEKLSGNVRFGLFDDYFVSKKEYEEIQEMKRFEDYYNETQDEVFIGSKEDIVEMILRDNQTIVFDCKKIDENKFKIEYKYVNFGGPNEGF